MCHLVTLGKRSQVKRFLDRLEDTRVVVDRSVVNGSRLDPRRYYDGGHAQTSQRKIEVPRKLRLVMVACRISGRDGRLRCLPVEESTVLIVCDDERAR